ncbi:hypothetical protein C8R46DRAFT_1145109 [Mycena filopes]|nr:hypothetical protein C8R46DRAFT_1145109 [Mycena filopes]
MSTHGNRRHSDTGPHHHLTGWLERCLARYGRRGLTHTGARSGKLITVLRDFKRPLAVAAYHLEEVTSTPSPSPPSTSSPASASKYSAYSCIITSRRYYVTPLPHISKHDSPGFALSDDIDICSIKQKIPLFKLMFHLNRGDFRPTRISWALRCGPTHEPKRRPRCLLANMDNRVPALDEFTDFRKHVCIIYGRRRRRRLWESERRYRIVWMRIRIEKERLD